MITLQHIKAALRLLTLAAAAMAGALTAGAQDDGNDKVIDIVPTDSVKAYMANVTASGLFTDAPLSVVPVIDRMTRMDMLDYFNSGSSKPSKNVFKGDSRVISLSDNQITVATSQISELTLAKLPTKKGFIIMAVNTLMTPIADSSVEFYDELWNKLDGLFTLPTLADWVKPEGKKRMKDIENLFPFTLQRIEYDEPTQNLLVISNLPQYGDREEGQWAAPLMLDKLTYHWDGKRFRQLKSK